VGTGVRRLGVEDNRGGCSGEKGKPQGGKSDGGSGGAA